MIIVQNLPLARDRRVRQEAEALVAAGYGVSVICPAADEPGTEVVDGIVVHSYRPPAEGSSRSGLLREFVYCWVKTAALTIRVVRSEGFDAVQACNPPDTYFVIGWMAKLAGKRFVFDHHDLCPELFESKFSPSASTRLLKRVILGLERATLRTADHVIATNDSYRDVALTRGGRASRSVSVVRSAPDLNRLTPVEPNPDLKNGRAHLCCYLGVMGSQDGVDLLLEAVAVLVHRFGRRDCHFALLGSGPCRQDLETLAGTLGIADWVTFTGWADDEMVKAYLSTSDIGVTPDPKNDFNDRCSMNKVVEYMALGLPVVAFDLDETIVSAGDAAEFAPGNDVELFAKTIATLLDDPERRARMGIIGRRRVQEELSWNAQVDTYLDVYERLLRGRGGGPSPSHEYAGPSPSPVDRWISSPR